MSSDIIPGANPSMNLETCAICLSEMDDESKIHQIDCNHRFHTTCIVKWFRLGTASCPLCNSNPNQIDEFNTSIFSYGSRDYINERCKTIRRLTRRKDCPQELKREFDKLKKYELEYKEFAKTKQIYLKTDEVKKMRKTVQQNNNKSWRKRSKVEKQKMKIVSLYPQLQVFHQSPFLMINSI